MITYAWTIPHIACSICTVIVRTVWFILFLIQKYLGKIQYQTETKAMKKPPEAKGKNCVKFKKILL